MIANVEMFHVNNFKLLAGAHSCSYRIIVYFIKKIVINSTQDFVAKYYVEIEQSKIFQSFVLKIKFNKSILISFLTLICLDLLMNCNSMLLKNICQLHNHSILFNAQSKLLFNCLNIHPKIEIWIIWFSLPYWH